jgi:2-dehydropantoate 2-reductase
LTASQPRIAIVGAGANGASIGADLAFAGEDVTFIEQWPEHVEAMRSRGVTINMPRSASLPFSAVAAAWRSSTTSKRLSG